MLLTQTTVRSLVTEPLDQRRGDQRPLPRDPRRCDRPRRRRANRRALSPAVDARPRRRSGVLARRRPASAPATPARTAPRRAGSARPPRRARATSASVPPGAPRRARRPRPPQRDRDTAPRPPSAFRRRHRRRPPRSPSRRERARPTARRAASRVASSWAVLCSGTTTSVGPNASAARIVGITSTRGGEPEHSPASGQQSRGRRRHRRRRHRRCDVGRQRRHGSRRRRRDEERVGSAVAAQRTDAHSASPNNSAAGPVPGHLGDRLERLDRSTVGRARRRSLRPTRRYGDRGVRPARACRRERASTARTGSDSRTACRAR